MNTVTIQTPWRWTGGRDEENFFNWLLSIPEVESVEGELIWLHVNLGQPLSCQSKQDFMAVLRRYNVPLEPLGGLIEDKWTADCIGETKCSCAYNYVRYTEEQPVRSPDEQEALRHFSEVRERNRQSLKP